MTVAAFRFKISPIAINCSDSLAPCPIITWTPPIANMTINVTAHVIVRDLDNAASCSFKIQAAFTVVAGTPTMIGTQTVLESKIEAGSTMLTPNLIVVGSAILLNTAMSVDNVSDWSGHLDIMGYQFS